MAERYLSESSVIQALEAIPEGSWKHIRFTKAIREIPAADVVEVVRCRDCKHNSTSYTRQFYQWCDEHHEYHVPDWFCADGKRKDGGQDE